VRCHCPTFLPLTFFANPQLPPKNRSSVRNAGKVVRSTAKVTPGAGWFFAEMGPRVLRVLRVLRKIISYLGTIWELGRFRVLYWALFRSLFGHYTGTLKGGKYLSPRTGPNWSFEGGTAGTCTTRPRGISSLFCVVTYGLILDYKPT